MSSNITNQTTLSWNSTAEDFKGAINHYGFNTSDPFLQSMYNTTVSHFPGMKDCFTKVGFLGCSAEKLIYGLPKFIIGLGAQTPRMVYTGTKWLCTTFTPNVITTEVSKFAQPHKALTGLADNLISNNINLVATAMFFTYSTGKAIDNGIGTLKSIKRFICCRFRETTQYRTTDGGIMTSISRSELTKELCGSRICGNFKKVMVNGIKTAMWVIIAYSTYEVIQGMMPTEQINQSIMNNPAMVIGGGSFVLNLMRKIIL